MRILQTIGKANESYTDRPTVKAVIQRDNKILILNDGLLPGGGIEKGENTIDALKRELREELGASIKNVIPIGSVVQYRDFLQKKYIVHGFRCELIDFNLTNNPQDDEERNFKQQWVSIESAITVINEAIATLKNKENSSDSIQGRLFNLMSTRAFLDEVKSRGV